MVKFHIGSIDEVGRVEFSTRFLVRVCEGWLSAAPDRV